VDDFLAQLELGLGRLLFEHEDYAGAEHRFHSVCDGHPDAGAAPEACYWAGVAAYKAKLRGLRGIPMAVQDILESIPANTHPMDVLRTGVSLLGALEPVHTFVSAILIVPFVGVVSGTPMFTPSDAEIAEVLSYPLEELMAAETTVEWPRDGLVYRGFAYPMSDGNTIWGATATIVNELMAIVRSRS